MIFANKLNYTLLSIYSINKNGKKNYNLYKRYIFCIYLFIKLTKIKFNYIFSEK